MVELTSRGGGSQLLRTMKGCSVFRHDTEDELRAHEPACAIRRLDRGDHLWRRGDRSGSLHYIVAGLIELRRVTPTADVNLVALVGPTEYAGLPTVLERRYYAADAVVASADARVLTIQAAHLHERLESDAGLMRAINVALLDTVHLLNDKVDVMGAGTVARRLALFFLHLADRFGDQHAGGETIIPLALSREQMARYIDARVETVIRALSPWRHDGTLLVHRDRVVIPDIDVLRCALAG